MARHAAMVFDGHQPVRDDDLGRLFRRPLPGRRSCQFLRCEATAPSIEARRMVDGRRRRRDRPQHSRAFQIFRIFRRRPDVLTGPIGVPLAISFYTFHIISYLVDVYRGKPKALGFGPYLFYLSFFPHVIAGPIVRTWQLVPQLRLTRRVAADWPMGLHFFVTGFFLKAICADNIADIIDPAWQSVVLSTADRWALAFRRLRRLQPNGAWHGPLARLPASCHVIWGFIHGAGLVLERLFRFRNLALSWLITQLVVTIAWVLFRLPWQQARPFLTSMFSLSSATLSPSLACAAVFAAPVVIHQLLPLLIPSIGFKRLPIWLGMMTGLLLIADLTIVSPSKVFLYFSF
jgi:hypothetical protein